MTSNGKIQTYGVQIREQSKKDCGTGMSSSK
jgi:hypothetical protein